MTSMDLHVSPLGRVEGDLDVRVTIEEYAAGDWLDNLKAAIELLEVQRESEG